MTNLATSGPLVIQHIIIMPIIPTDCPIYAGGALAYALQYRALATWIVIVPDTNPWRKSHAVPST